MEKNIKTLKGQSQILDVLKEFEPYLNTLKRGESYQTLMAKKFAQNAEVLALYIDADCAGFLAFYANNQSNKTAYISMIAVKESYRRMGIGNSLFRECIQVALNRGMKRLKLEVNKNNSNAIGFYKKNGLFVTTELENSLYMEKNLEE